MPKILPLARMGEPVLRQKAEPVDFNDMQDIPELIEDMKYTLISLGERVGLAAPQVFVSKRLLIFRVPEKLHPRYASDEILEPLELHPLINPEIEYVSEETEDGYEACISVPGLMGKVKRSKRIRYSYFDMNKKKHIVDASGFHARVVQHEFDHLDGILYPQRMNDLSTLGFEQEVCKNIDASLS